MNAKTAYGRWYGLSKNVYISVDCGHTAYLENKWRHLWDIKASCNSPFNSEMDHIKGKVIGCVKLCRNINKEDASLRPAVSSVGSITPEDNGTAFSRKVDSNIINSAHFIDILSSWIVIDGDMLSQFQQSFIQYISNEKLDQNNHSTPSIESLICCLSQILRLSQKVFLQLPHRVHAMISALR